MKVTCEVLESLTLIYVYIRTFNGKSVNTIPGAKCELLFDEENNWIGLNVFNEYHDGGKFSLPEIKIKTENTDFEAIQQFDEKTSLIFDSRMSIANSKIESCNIDFNEDGLFGIEIILNYEIRY